MERMLCARRGASERFRLLLKLMRAPNFDSGRGNDQRTNDEAEEGR